MPFWDSDSEEQSIRIIQLVRKLMDPDPTVRDDAADALKKMEPAVIAGVPGLITRLNKSYGFGKSGANQALCLIGPAVVEAVVALTQHTLNNECELRAMVSEAIERTRRDLL